MGVVRHHRLILPGQRLLVAVSGGPDSVALLALFHRNAAKLGISLAAAHLDHQIRRESSDDARFVARFCTDLGVELITEVTDVPALARAEKEGLEAAGRRARRAFLLKSAGAHDCARIALGHHRGDQAETVLHRLLRGTGVSGLAAMAMQRGCFIRPLLLFDRELILAFLTEHRLPYRQDASNSDLTFTRNRIRHELLPQMRGFNPRIEEHLASLSRRIAIEEDFWREQESRALDAAQLSGGEKVLLDRQVLLALHPALRIRVLRRALELSRGDLLEISTSHLEAVDALLVNERPQGELHLPRSWVGRRYNHLLVRPVAPEVPTPFTLDIPGPGSYVLPGGGCLRVSVEEVTGLENSTVVEFAAGQIDFPLKVRTFQPGDRFRPSGCGTKKLKSFFIDAKIPREDRMRLPLLVGSELLWVIGLRRCAGYRSRVAGEKVLRIHFTGPFG
jgi:tRNA(Ile)-lysidine synthase